MTSFMVEGWAWLIWLCKEDIIFYLCEDIKNGRIEIIENVADFMLIFFMSILSNCEYKFELLVSCGAIIYVKTIMRIEFVN